MHLLNKALLFHKIFLFFQFQFSDKLDKFLLIVGSLASFISGLGFPVSVLLYGEIATYFIYFTILQDR